MNYRYPRIKKSNNYKNFQYRPGIQQKQVSKDQKQRSKPKRAGNILEKE